MQDECPVCGLRDQTRKVSAIVNEGTFSMRTSGNSLGVAVVPGGVAPVAMVNNSSTTGQSTLASWLAFPTFRKPGAMFGWGVGLLAFGAVIAAVVAVLLAIAPDPAGDKPSLWLVPAWFFIAGWKLWIPGGLLAFFGHRAIRRFRAEEPRRQQAWRTWNTLRYCARDGIVYLPGTQHAFHPSMTRSFIFGGDVHEAGGLQDGAHQES